jgi:hypothetical protein
MKDKLIEYLLNFIENENLKNKINNIFEPLLKQIYDKINPLIYLLLFFSISNFITNLGILLIILLKYQKYRIINN